MEKIYLDVPFLGPLEGTLEWKKKYAFQLNQPAFLSPGLPCSTETVLAFWLRHELFQGQ